MEKFNIAMLVNNDGCFDLQFRKDTRRERTNSPTYYRWKAQFVVTSPKEDVKILEKIKKAVSEIKSFSGRMQKLKGIKNSIIIDDTYNSSPFACESALKTLKGIKYGKRKIAILGDMLELGRHTHEAHENIGKIARENLKEKGLRDINRFDDAEAARIILASFLQKKAR